MQQYWFWLQPYTFIFQSNDEMLFYNSETGYSFLEKMTPSIKDIFEELQKPENAYCISLSENDIKDEKISQLINRLRYSFSGDLITQELSKGKPFVFKPILRLTKDVEVLRKEKDRGIGDSVVQFINEVCIYLNSNCNQNCLDCSHYYKQYSYCNANRDEGNEVELYRFIQFLNKLETGGVMKVVFSGGNIFSSQNLHPLLKIYSESRFKKVIQFNYLNYPIEDSILKNLANNIQTEILVHFPIHKKLLKNALIRSKEIKVKWIFIVTSRDEYFKANKIIEVNNLDAGIKPFYNGQNINFFKINIYTEVKDFKIKMNRRSIFARQKINENDFGKLTVMPDGKIYANLYHDCLGTIDDDIRELIYDEMDKGTSWRRIRDMKPCCDCVYQWLCPSPSNYELAIDKPNLCHVKLKKNHCNGKS